MEPAGLDRDTPITGRWRTMVAGARACAATGALGAVLVALVDVADRPPVLSMPVRTSMAASPSAPAPVTEARTSVAVNTAPLSRPRR